MKENEESRIIVFTQFRDTVNNIYEKCLQNDIKAVKFFGQAAKEGEKGLTQKKQKEVIKSFKMGTYDVLISTSVAEEGIDIPAVDLSYSLRTRTIRNQDDTTTWKNRKKK